MAGSEFSSAARSEQALVHLIEVTHRLLVALDSERLFGAVVTHGHEKPEVDIELPQHIIYELCGVVGRGHFDPTTARLIAYNPDAKRRAAILLHAGRVIVHGHAERYEPSYYNDR